MSTDVLKERERALENAWFQKREAELAERRRAAKEREARARALGEACGLEDAEVLNALVDLGIEAEAVAALALVPLVAMAWADGRLGVSERQAVLDAAHHAGVDRGRPGYALLEEWLETRPAPLLYKTWIEFARALRDQLDEGQRAALRKDFVDRARDIAEAAGGVLNLGPHVSSEEHEMLEEIANVF
ncbi:MAG: hypothetical protein ACQGVK_20615 [Myxococcota bacterium]